MYYASKSRVANFCRYSYFFGVVDHGSPSHHQFDQSNKIVRLSLLHHSMVEAMAVVKKTPSHFEPTLLSESTTVPKTNSP